MKRFAGFIRRRRRLFAGAALALAVFAGWVWFTPFPEDLLSRETVWPFRVLARDGQPLREGLTPDGTRARWVPLAEISPVLVEAVLVAEDRRFREHCGVDPRAVLRAAWDDAWSFRRVSGASTVTMQLVRLLRPRSRTWKSKIEESVLAIRLERRLTKNEILEEYLNRAPFAGNIRGVDAAARQLLGKPARDLSPAEAALLAGLPQSPGRLDPRRHPERAMKRQHWILDEMHRLGRLDDGSWRRALDERVRVLAASGQVEAFEFTEWVRRPGDREVRSTLDLGLQRDIEGILRANRDVLAAAGASEAAVVVLDNATGEVLAFAGPAARRRSPGSTLKPFIYALALEDGATAATIFKDAPVEFDAPTGPYAPRNYDGIFHGPVTLRAALANSLNIPAVLALRTVGIPRAVELFRAAGLIGIEGPPAEHGLGLAIGDSSVSPVELAGAYAALAREGQFLPAHGRGQAELPARLCRPETAWLIGDILSDDAARSLSFGTGTELDLDPPVAAKTGTSADHRDNWVAGFSASRTVVVWAGNADGRPLRGTCGLEGAGPIFRAIMLRLGPAPLPPAPPGLRRVEVCADSGGEPGAGCDRTLREWIPSGASFHDCSLPPPAFRLTFPREGDIFVADPESPPESQFLVFHVDGGEGAIIGWTLDGEALAATRDLLELKWNLKAGTHRLEVTRGGIAARCAFTVRDREAR